MRDALPIEMMFRILPLPKATCLFHVYGVEDVKVEANGFMCAEVPESTYQSKEEVSLVLHLE